MGYPIIRSIPGALNHRCTLWALLAIPAYPLIIELIFDDQHYPELMHTTGTFSAQLLVIALAITPLQRVAKRWKQLIRPTRWLVSRRRHIGVASFVYALAHTVLYLLEMDDLYEVWIKAFDFELLIGWLGFLGLLMLAVTSNSISVNALGKYWKRLQRLAYPIAAFVFLHWYIFDPFFNEVLYWFMPLLGLQIFRLTDRFVMKSM